MSINCSAFRKKTCPSELSQIPSHSATSFTPVRKCQPSGQVDCLGALYRMGLKMTFKCYTGPVFKGCVGDLSAVFLETNCEERMFCNVYNVGSICCSSRSAAQNVLPIFGLVN
jgi:hypothetical protein